MTDVKFCGLTQREDAEFAVSLGAAAIGVVFAPSPRRLSAHAGRDVLGAADGTEIVRVGVFVESDTDSILQTARIARLDVVQVHGPEVRPDLARIRAEGFGVWLVQPVALDGATETSCPPDADLILLDTSAHGRSGGTGIAFDWEATRASADLIRGQCRLGVAGGLHAANVTTAVHILLPDLVDVSSGVETRPGIKAHHLMSAFMSAVATPQTK